MSKVNLSLYSGRDYHPGRPLWIRLLWMVVEALTLLNPVFLSSGLKQLILRVFGGVLGTGIIIKPNVHVKHPWRLKIGDHCWLGERAWIDNLVSVTLGNHVCISQGAYLCTGNHDWSDPGMAMMAKPISVEDGAWIGAFAVVGPGVTVGPEAVVTMGSVLLSDADSRGVYQGNPAVKIRQRTIMDVPGLLHVE
jgi:putative colanic acid biosynthesis acetyltransferase WcaF